jgi:hypothetical protein
VQNERHSVCEWLLVVREDKTAQLFGCDGKPGAKLMGSVDSALAPTWSEDNSMIAALVSTTWVGFWKKDGTETKTVKHEKPVLGLHWKPGGALLATTETGGKRYFW